MAKADLIFVRCKRGPIRFDHFGIDIGDGTVVHLATEPESNEMSVQRVSIEDFANGGIVQTIDVDDPLPCDVVIEHALRAVGNRGYHLVAENCEHFARRVKTGRGESVQVDMYVSAVLRTAFSGIAHASSRNVIAKSISILSQSKFLLTAGSLVPTMLGESVRCGSYLAARKLNLSHEHAERSSRSVGHAACALGGLVVGGPAGSVGALAISVAADRVADSLHRKLKSQN